MLFLIFLTLLLVGVAMLFIASDDYIAMSAGFLPLVFLASSLALSSSVSITSESMAMLNVTRLDTIRSCINMRIIFMTTTMTLVRKN